MMLRIFSRFTLHVSRFTNHALVAPRSDEDGSRFTHPSSVVLLTKEDHASRLTFHHHPTPKGFHISAQGCDAPPSCVATLGQPSSRTPQPWLIMRASWRSPQAACLKFPSHYWTQPGL